MFHAFSVALAALHFNENADKLTLVKDGDEQLSVVFPKYRNEEFIIKKRKMRSTYGK